VPMINDDDVDRFVQPADRAPTPMNFPQKQSQMQRHSQTSNP
jgi:hypothetical protein